MTSLVNWKGREKSPTLRSAFPEFFGLDNFFEEPGLFPSFWQNRRMTAVPATNIRELDAEYVVEMAAPGMEKKDFVVDVCDGYLEIKVDKETKSEKEEELYTKREYNYNSFYRSFYLPETLNADNIKAEYINGVLKVHLPKKTGVEKKKAVKEIKVV